MKYLITGINGFIGNFIKEALIKEGENEIYGLVRWSHTKQKIEGYIPVYGDLSNYHDMVSIIKDIKPDIVLNLGAITPVSLSFEKPFDYFDINTIGVVNLVEANRRFNPYLKKFIHASTPEVYGIQEQPLTPESPLYPNSPYAVSKAGADMYLNYAFRSYGFPAIMSRHANCYGRKDQTHFVIESIVTQMINKEPEMYLGAKDPKRDFIHVDDVVNFYMSLIKRGEPGNVYTAGWNQSYSIEDVVELAKKLTNYEGRVVWDSIPKRPGEVPEIRLNPEKANKDLGWEPHVPLHQGIQKVIDHWSRVKNGK